MRMSKSKNTQTSSQQVDVAVNSNGQIDGHTGKVVATNVYIEDKLYKEHIHIGIDENGNTLFDKRRPSNSKK